MNITIDLNTILTAIVGVGVTWAVSGIRNINKKLVDLNGGMRETKMWQADHEKLNDERDAKTSKSLDGIWQRLDRE